MRIIVAILTAVAFAPACGDEAPRSDVADTSEVRDVADDVADDAVDPPDVGEDAGTDDTARDAEDAAIDSEPDVEDASETDGGVPAVCTPGARRCRDANYPEECNDTGTEWVRDPEPCGEVDGRPTLCGGSGECTTLCDINARQRSHLGCDFWIVDVDIAAPTAADAYPLTVVVANPHPTLAAAITITGFGVGVGSVPPQSVERFVLPDAVFTRGTGIHETGTNLLWSSLPVTVQQFAGLVAEPDTVGASLVLPANSLGREYIVLGRPTSINDATFMGTTVDVVATTDGTWVTVTSPVTIPPGGGVPGFAVGVPVGVSLNRGQRLHLVAEPTMPVEPSHPPIDVSGMVIVADADVAVFSGTRADLLPPTTCCGDQVQEQLPGVADWGTVYVVPKSPSRGTEDDFVRVVGSRDGTTVSVAPAQYGVSSFPLGRADVFEFRSATDFVLAADQPVMLGQATVGSQHAGVTETCTVHSHQRCSTLADCAALGAAWECAPGGYCHIPCSSSLDCPSEYPTCSASGGCSFPGSLGDPSFLLVPDVDGYRTDFVVSVVETASVTRWLTLVTQAGHVPLIDGAPVTDPPHSATAVPVGSDWAVYRLQPDPGAVFLMSTEPFGVLVHGYGCDAAYALPGGFSL